MIKPSGCLTPTLSPDSGTERRITVLGLSLCVRPSTASFPRQSGSGSGRRRSARLRGCSVFAPSLFTAATPGLDYARMYWKIRSSRGQRARSLLLLLLPVIK
ncbi:hypothetical protein JOB18_016116 [Solea senegalensis]|uniref:Uncharacterized protein n=1 Tax=Solea senegalensis TaxID=28829 RepID=A0AAV6RV88_SOLSE|nr:hypothetical protein JOB18_016116 [Solea senegalensis]